MSRMVSVSSASVRSRSLGPRYSQPERQYQLCVAARFLGAEGETRREHLEDLAQLLQLNGVTVNGRSGGHRTLSRQREVCSPGYDDAHRTYD
jgi:hypothetical protein